MTFQDMVMQASKEVLNHAAIDELVDVRGRETAEIANKEDCHFDE